MNFDTGFIVIDGYRALFGTSNKKILQIYEAKLYPIFYGRGPKRCSRFIRIREESIKNYIKKSQELCELFFLTNGKINVKELFICGNTDLKFRLFDVMKIYDNVKVIDTLYSGEDGFDEAIRTTLGTPSQ